MVCIGQLFKIKNDNIEEIEFNKIKDLLNIRKWVII